VTRDSPCFLGVASLASFWASWKCSNFQINYFFALMLLSPRRIGRT